MVEVLVAGVQVVEDLLVVEDNFYWFFGDIFGNEINKIFIKINF